jgi:hypothetical protein
MEIGTSCRFWDRRCAVTTISPRAEPLSVPSAAAAPATSMEWPARTADIARDNFTLDPMLRSPFDVMGAKLRLCFSERRNEAAAPSLHVSLGPRAISSIGRLNVWPEYIGKATVRRLDFLWLFVCFLGVTNRRYFWRSLGDPSMQPWRPDVPTNGCG